MIWLLRDSVCLDPQLQTHTVPTVGSTQAPYTLATPQILSSWAPAMVRLQHALWVAMRWSRSATQVCNVSMTLLVTGAGESALATTRFIM